MKQSNFIDNKKTKPDYRNWVPVSLLRNFIGGTIITFILFIIFAGTELVFSGTPRIICGIILGIGVLILLFFQLCFPLCIEALTIGVRGNLPKLL